MSAFIVSSGTMNRALFLIEQETKYRDKLLGVDLHQRGALTALGRRLFALNLAAVQQRYPGETEESAPGPCDTSNIHDRYTYRIPAVNCISNRYDGIKALQCLIYQCAEGNVRDSAEFRELQDIERNAMASLIRMHPDYEKAAWDSAD